MRVLLCTLSVVLLLGTAIASSLVGDVVNDKCPISDQPVKDGVVVSTDGGDIGVCCNKCKAAVEKWSDGKKAEFVASAKTGEKKQAGKDAKKPDAKPAKWGEPYLLDVCAASGRPLDVKGTPTTKIVEGRELKFCCGGCAKVVAEEPAKWLPRVDEKITERQRSIYPTETCVVSGEPLMEDGKDVATSLVVNNRLFRVCCKMCAKKVTKEPAKYAEKLDGLAMEAQAKAYPLKACVVNPKGEIGEDSTKMMIGGRLVVTCCGTCAKKVKNDPAKYVAKVDAARAEKAPKEKPKAKSGAKAKDASGGNGL
ncbi:MAG: hypothetical protein AAF957_16915 [Planctomycetota bacterium]